MPYITNAASLFWRERDFSNLIHPSLKMVARKEPFEEVKSLLEVGMLVIKGMRLGIPDGEYFFLFLSRNTHELSRRLLSGVC